MKSVPWAWVLITALVTLFVGPKVMGMVAGKRMA